MQEYKTNTIITLLVMICVIVIFFMYIITHMVVDIAKLIQDNYEVSLRIEQEYINIISEQGEIKEEVKELEEDENQKVYLGQFKITAYCPCVKCCGQSADGITSTGTVATQNRTIAVDPNIIPYGSKVEIEGLPYTYIAEDCGGSIKSNKIDLYFDLHEDAVLWGVKYRDVYIIQ